MCVAEQSTWDNAKLKLTPPEQLNIGWVVYANGSQVPRLFEILGVPRSASQDEIKSAFRKLARKLHPDVNPGDKAAEDRFKEIDEANEVLSDPKKRRYYDELGARLEGRDGFHTSCRRSRWCQRKQWRNK